MVYLLDANFSKPQAFHEKAVTRSGGVAAIISLTVFLYLLSSLF